MTRASAITAQQWTQVQRLLDELELLPPDARATALSARAIPDERVRTEVQSLLDAAAASEGFLESPPWREPGASAAMPTLSPGSVLGAFRIECLIGRGGTAEVYRAHRVADFEQRVAIKLIAGNASTRLDAFQRERRILAGLEHPGVSRIVDGGITEAGRPYMVMEYVEGTDLVTHAQERRLGLRARLDLFRQVCEAVSFAHRHLVIHRDLKPANIRVTPGGQVKLLDFGVAKLLQSGVRTAALETATILTPEFAAPEQLYGEPVTTATDVYALGLVLFQLLCGVPAFHTAGRPIHLVIDERLRSPVPNPSATAAAQPNPPLPARQLRGDLDAIVARATRRKPSERYANADALWADLARHLDHQPVVARRGNTSYQLRRLLHTYRAGTLAIGVIAIIGVVSLQNAWSRARAAVRADQAAQMQILRAERGHAVLLEVLATVPVAQKSAIGASDLDLALDGAQRRIDEELSDDPVLQAQMLLDLSQVRANRGDADDALVLARRAATLLERYPDQASLQMRARERVRATELGTATAARRTPEFP